MIREIPAPGYRLISGKRNPPETVHGYFVQIRNGHVSEDRPWPARGGGVRWKWDEEHHPGDVVAVKDARK